MSIVLITLDQIDATGATFSMAARELEGSAVGSYRVELERSVSLDLPAFLMDQNALPADQRTDAVAGMAQQDAQTGDLLTRLFVERLRALPLSLLEHLRATYGVMPLEDVGHEGYVEAMAAHYQDLDTRGKLDVFNDLLMQEGMIRMNDTSNADKE